MVFESVKKERTAKAWSYFLLEKSTEKAQCILCKKILKATGSSTKSLNDHLKLKHANEWMKDSKIENSPQKVLKTKCQPKIDTFVKPQKKSPEEVISRLALDNIPFSTISRSEMIREHFYIAGVDIPKSSTTIQKMIIDHSNNKKNELILKLGARKEADKRFTLSLDEYTSQRNRRYLNINAHCKDVVDEVFCLGLCRVQGSMPSDILESKVQNHLKKFNLDLYKDIICATTDGANLMKAWGKKIPCLHLLCVLHGINLAIIVPMALQTS